MQALERFSHILTSFQGEHTTKITYQQGGTIMPGEKRLLAITLRLPVPLKRALEKEADRKAVTLHDLILFTLWAAQRCSSPE